MKYIINDMNKYDYYFKTCRNCHASFLYQEEDIEYNMLYKDEIRCPVCGYINSATKIKTTLTPEAI